MIYRFRRSPEYLSEYLGAGLDLLGFGLLLFNRPWDEPFINFIYICQH